MLEFTEASRSKMRFWIAPKFVSGVMERPDGTTTIVTSDGEMWHVNGEAEGIAKLIAIEKEAK